MSWNLNEIAELVAGELMGPGEVRILRPVSAGTNDPEGVTFAESEDALEKIKNSHIGAVLISLQEELLNKPCIRVEDPRAAFNEILIRYERPLSIEPDIHPTAIVHPSANVDPSAVVGAYTVVGPEVQINAGVKIYPHCYIGDRSVVGEGSVLYPRVVLYHDVILDQKVILHSGVVLGADGFGYYWDGKQHVKIPQVGHVKIGAFVEIGANSSIDRATCEVTEVGAGTKIDNQVQIGHNVHLGRCCIVCGQAGIAGSCEIGDGVVIGGQVAIKDHSKIVSGARLAGRTGVMQDIEKPGDYYGVPAMPIRQAMRKLALEQRLPELFERLKAVEKMLDANELRLKQ